MASASKGRGGKPAAPVKKTPWLLIIAAGGLVLALVGVMFLLRPALDSGSATTAPAAGGAPRLEVDQKQLDFGDVPFEQPVVATFRLTNTGDAPLQIMGEPVVAAVEGC